MNTRAISLFAAFALLSVPAFADGANESSETMIFPVPGATEVALPQSVMTETEALALPEPEMEAAAPAFGCRKNSEEVVYLTN
jgi:hypothetical protein